MNIHVRLRDGRDDDIAAWYVAQDDKSEAVRAVIRSAIRLENGDAQEKLVREAVARELSCLPDIVAGAVREALAAHRLVPAASESAPDGEDPELAARLDAQLDDFFED